MVLDVIRFRRVADYNKSDLLHLFRLVHKSPAIDEIADLSSISCLLRLNTTKLKDNSAVSCAFTKDFGTDWFVIKD